MRFDAGDLRRLLQQGEGSALEFKLGLPTPRKVARTLAAFANGRGGTLLIGVDDNRRPRGVTDAEAVARELAEVAEGWVDPPLGPRVVRVELDGLAIVAAIVGRSDALPHAVRRQDGTVEVPIRLGSSTRAASGEALRRLRRGPSKQGGPSELERAILAWVARQPDPGARGTPTATVAAFARAHNVGRARARRAFWKLEHAGRLVATGEGARRAYSLP